MINASEQQKCLTRWVSNSQQPEVADGDGACNEPVQFPIVLALEVQSKNTRNSGSVETVVPGGLTINFVD